MNPSSAMKFFCVVFSILITVAAVSSAPYSSDYDSDVPDNIRDLFEILLQRDNLEDRMGLHQVVRKSRGPQLRLRFGKRPDTGYEPVVKRPRSLRLRFGKRSDELPIAAYMSGVPTDMEN